MPKNDRVENLIKLYKKYRESGLRVQASRTLDRIYEVGGRDAQERAIAEANEALKGGGE